MSVNLFEKRIKVSLSLATMGDEPAPELFHWNFYCPACGKANEEVPALPGDEAGTIQAFEIGGILTCARTACHHCGWAGQARWKCRPNYLGYEKDCWFHAGAP